MRWFLLCLCEGRARRSFRQHPGKVDEIPGAFFIVSPSICLSMRRGGPLLVLLVSYFLTAGTSVRLPAEHINPFKKLEQHGQTLKRAIEEGFRLPWMEGPTAVKGQGEEQEEEYSGSRVLRMMNFWARALDIYGGYKVAQIRINVAAAFIREPEERERLVEEWWNDVHEKSSDKMLDLCLDLRGFYCKAGQFLATRLDLCPLPIVVKLSTLHDRVPPIPADHVKRVIEEELGSPIDKVFSYLNLDHPVGAASICQVHEGRLRTSNEKVAVKVQYPNAEAVMRADLINLKALCSYLKTFELKFDLVSMITELQKQISQEFDFNIEANSLRAVGPLLEKGVRNVQVPKPYMATRRLLVMSFLEGTQITRLGDLGYGTGGGKVSKKLPLGRKRLATGLLNKMAEAWGFMLFRTELFHADPHPGNILVMPGLKLGILDWGQTKRLDRKTRAGLARLVVAMGHNNEAEIVNEFYRLGIETERRDDPEDIVRLAFSIFDTRHVDGYCSNPLDKDHGLNKNAVLSFPSELAYVLRSVQIMRGMAMGMGVDYSLTDKWAPMAKALLQEEEGEGSDSSRTSPR